MSTINTSSTARDTEGTGGVTGPGTSGRGFHPDPAKVARAIARRSFCTLATTSPSGRPHAAGVLYALADGALYVSTLRTSRKARNIADNPRVGVVIPVRRLPVGPPSSVQFQAVAEILEVDDPGVRRLADAGRLKAITGHGELDLPDGCVVRITPPRRVLTYGLGMPLRRLVRDPLDAAGAVELDLT
ncbi:MAG TPA: pyridoxamine 5'-phosphate oxidase family protein [Acidimicrobiales bacterium]